MSETSPGNKLSGAAGALISSAFFLPWVRACGSELTGYDLATNRPGSVEDPWIYWLVPIGGIACLLIAFLLRGMALRLPTAIIRLVIALVGFLPLLNVWYNSQRQGADIELLYGSWLTAAGYFAIFISFFVDVFSDASKPADNQDSVNYKDTT